PDTAAGTLPEGRGPWLATIETIGAPRDGQQVGTIRLDGGPGGGLRVAATLPRYPPIEPGLRVEVEGAIKPRPDSPYGTYLERTGVSGTIRANALRVTGGPADAWASLEGLRRAAGDALAAALPEPEAGLAAGILIGLRDRVDRDLAADFTTVGASHVVAISGWNIAIVAAAVASLGGRLGRRRRSVLTLGAIVAYVAFAGASASVVRAGVMAGVVLLARESGRAGRAAAALGWAATLLVLVDPGLVRDAGFQLSSLATAGILAWATPLTSWFARLGGGRLPAWLAENLGVSFAAQAATLPIVLATFGRLALVSPAVNLVVVPLVPVAMVAGLLAFVAGTLGAVGVPGVLVAVLAAPGWVTLGLVVAIVEWWARLPFASLTLEPDGAIIAGAACVVGLGALEWWRRARAPATRHPPLTAGSAAPRPARAVVSMGRSTRLATFALVVAVIVTVVVFVERPDGTATVTVLDVGQGDAILIEGSRGGRLLVDGGPSPESLLVALDRRIPPWDRRLDAVVLTHPHEDHVAGLAVLLDRYRVGRTFEPGMRGPGPGFAAWSARLALDGPPRTGLAAGDVLSVDEIGLRVLWPRRGSVPSEPADGGTGINNVSIVLLGSVGSHRFLLAGDVEEEIDPELLGAGVPRLDLLKVAHHGSRTATTEPFVAAARPRIAVASAGARNRYGHPAAATLGRLADAGARVYRTDRDGTVSVSFTAGGVTARAEGTRGARGPVRSTVAARPTWAQIGPAPPSAAFFCGVPAGPFVGSSDDPSAPVPTVPPLPATRAGAAGALLYHRADVGPRAGGSRLPPALPRPARLVPPSRPRGGRGRRLAGGADRRPRDGDRPAPRRVGRAPPRCRQARPAWGSGASPPPRRGLRSVAHRPRPP
ncbi:MAG: DNA internalization-related competence protein ComEC/Rec2, partial [Chloroflexi bacterium]|nr:DNA internalization-related competence protein ComEC/Rec2 [Chloroflexota bacterium]